MENMSITILILIGLFSFFLGILVYYIYQKTRIMNAEKIRDKIISEARRVAEVEKKKAALKAKEEYFQARKKVEEEREQTRERMEKYKRKLTELQLSYKKKMENLEKMDDEYKRKEKEYQLKDKKVNNLERKYNDLIQEQNIRLLKIVGISKEEAKKELLDNLNEEVKYESAQMLKEMRERTLETATKDAKNIITTAIQRCAADHTAESTISVINLPNNGIKGKIIGREGRNIRAFESATGIEVIVDDTPEAVILSGFDPIKREIARMSLEELIIDGKINPELIEQIVKKKRKELDEIIMNTAQDVIKSLGIQGINPELMKLLGKLKFRTSYGQNVLQHSVEVALLTGFMATELELDIPSFVARRAGLLHDIGKAIDREMEGTHTEIGFNIAKKYNEPPLVLKSIAGHHNGTEEASILTHLVSAADAISGSRPGARRETLENYVKRLDRLEELADSFNGVEKAYAIQAGREVRVIVEADKLDDEKSQLLASEIAKKITKEIVFPGQIMVTVIRETKAISYAR